MVLIIKNDCEFSVGRRVNYVMNFFVEALTHHAIVPWLAVTYRAFQRKGSEVDIHFGACGIDDVHVVDMFAFGTAKDTGHNGGS